MKRVSNVDYSKAGRPEELVTRIAQHTSMVFSTYLISAYEEYFTYSFRGNR